MKLKLLISIIVSTCILMSIQSQALYLPSGVNGIGSSINGNVGVGTNQPAEKFEILGGNLKTSGVIYSTADGYAQTFLRSWGLNGNGTIYIEPQASHDLYLTDSWSRTGMFNVQFGKSIFETGNVGIGTVNPGAPLEINSSLNDHGLIVGANGKNTKVYLHVSGGDYGYLFLGGNTTLRGNGNESYFDGNVGIGVSGGGYKLNVKGRIRANEIVVNTTGADFVFEPTYKLRTLRELETFIRTNKHLPDIAPAKEMQENGVSAGEMQTKLLQKVEELTLYVIEKDKQLSEQMEINTEQQQLLLSLKERLEELEKKNSVNKK